MNLYKNWIPIQFGGGNIVLWKSGFTEDEHLVREGQAWKFSTKGVEYQWPASEQGMPKTGTAVSVSPGDAPRLSRAILEFMLGQGLAPFQVPGQVQPEEEGSWEVEISGVRYRLVLHTVQGFNHPSYLIVLPQEAASGSKLLRLTKEASKALAMLDFSNGAGTEFRLLPFLDSEAESARFAFQDPDLNFRPDSTLKHRNKWAGLVKFGPHSIDSFRTKSIDCLVIAPPAHMGMAARLMGELRDGMPQTRVGTNYPWPKPWSKAFHFANLSLRQLPFKGMGRTDLEDLCSKAIQSRKPDLVFVFLEPESANLPAEQDPYVVLKAELLKYGLPSQMILTSTCGLPEPDRAKALRNIALAAYAKVGGKPWLLPRQGFMNHELVIGVGATPLRAGVAGFSMIFTRDGDFRLGNSSIRPGIGDWQAALGSFVADQIRRLAVEDQWEKQDSVELTFHLAEELEQPNVADLRRQILDALEDQFNLQFTFLSLRQHHHFQIWDTDAPGVRMPDGERTGEYQMRRGSMVLPDIENAFLQLHKTEDPGLFNLPLHLHRHPESDSYDLGYLGEQVYRMSCISWRGMGHSTLPVTLEYGNALTRLLERFDSAGLGTDVESALVSHPQKTWFL